MNGFAELIDEGRTQIDGRDDGSLPLWWRQQLWSTLDRAMGNETAHRLRVRLAKKVVVNLFPLWNKLDVETADRQVFENLLNALDAFEAGEVCDEEFQRTLRSSRIALQNIGKSETNQADLAIALAALSASQCALTDEYRNPAPSLCDSNVDPDLFDSHFLASVASSGAPWDANSDVTKRREYWHHWLDDLVAMAQVEEM